MVETEFPGVKWLIVGCHSTVRNPNALPVKVYIPFRRTACGFLGASTWKQRPVEHCQLRLTGWIGNDGWEKTGILVVNIIEVDAI